ncbi:MAG: SpaH/EbpB family LPXTG-anchored major pilin [Clostridia bacterium]|nr:SpaH/EbpB family LPXTG-anchored major pilin [Clostridia bacterium]
MKKILALVVAMLLALGMVSALAATGADAFLATSTVSVTVTGVKTGDTLHLYKLGTPSVDANNQMTITWNNDEIKEAIVGKTTENWSYSPTAALQAGVAKLVADNKISVAGNGDYHKEATDTSVQVDVAPGYYLALVRQGDASKTAKVIYQNMLIDAIPEAGEDGIWATHAAVEATVKSASESLDKKQQEKGSTTYTDDDIVGYKFGEYVPFQVTTNIPSYPNNSKEATFEITDTATGLKLVNNVDYPVTVKVDGAAVTAGDDTYTLTLAADGTTMSIAFAKAYILAHPNAAVEVTYSAELLGNDNDVEVDVTNNKVKIKYNNNPDESTYQEPEDEVKEKTYNFTLLKHDKDNENKALKGAKFTLWDAATEGNKIALKKDGTVYRPIKAGETADEYIEVGDDGKATVVGLAKTTYYLQEDIAPAGYTRMQTRASVAVSETTSTADVDVKVPNEKGVELPTTGGIGTTIFYIGGSILVLAAVILLVTKRRMNVND